jgi:hypothetical protein
LLATIKDFIPGDKFVILARQFVKVFTIVISKNFVSHGGMNSVHDALYLGVPPLVLELVGRN